MLNDKLIVFMSFILNCRPITSEKFTTEINLNFADACTSTFYELNMTAKLLHEPALPAILYDVSIIISITGKIVPNK